MLEQIRVRNGQLPALSPSEREIARSFAEKMSPAEKHNASGLLALKQAWKEPKWRTDQKLATLHLFVGAPGCGKSTCLAKWLAQEVLLAGRTAQVWRLDGATANTAEALSIQAEVLGVPVSRAWSGETGWEIGFVDLPGIDWPDTAEFDKLAAQIGGLTTPQVHLVLNLAYENSVLMNQVRAFSRLEIADLIFTHLDEVPNKTKLLDFLFQTQYPISFFSSGQNIPGCFQPVTPEGLWAELGGGGETSEKPALVRSGQNGNSSAQHL
jgi:flagellar biosynthesis protein FlhF